MSDYKFKVSSAHRKRVFDGPCTIKMDTLLNVVKRGVVEYVPIRMSDEEWVEFMNVITFLLRANEPLYLITDSSCRKFKSCSEFTDKLLSCAAWVHENIDDIEPLLYNHFAELKFGLNEVLAGVYVDSDKNPLGSNVFNETVRSMGGLSPEAIIAEGTLI